MKISVADLDGELAQPVILGDDAGGDLICDPPPLPSETRANQKSRLAFGERAFGKGRGNRETRFRWIVQRTHADLAAANAFVWSHAESVPINCRVVITDDSGTEHVFARAVLTEVSFTSQAGSSTWTQYGIEDAIPE